MGLIRDFLYVFFTTGFGSILLEDNAFVNDLASEQSADSAE